MASPVTLTVIFETHLEDGIPNLASEHLEKIKEPNRDVRGFLEYVSKGFAVGFGPKGSVLSWGHVGNYSIPEDFMCDLKPFWLDLYKIGAIQKYDAIIVMSQREQADCMTIFELRKGEETGNLMARRIDTSVPSFGINLLEREILPSGCTKGKL